MKQDRKKIFNLLLLAMLIISVISIPQVFAVTEEPSPFSASPATGNPRKQIDIAFTRGANATHTYMRYKAGASAPTSRADGTFWANSDSAGGTQIHAGLSPGDVYSYSAWGYNSSDNNYSAAYATTTTTTNSNNLSSITGESPVNSSTGQGLAPACNITVSDLEADTMTVYFYENTTSSWVLQQTNSSVANNTNVSWDSFSNASSYGTTYYWSVNVTDSYNWTNATFHFTTMVNNAPTLTEPSPANSSIGQSPTPQLSIDANDTESDTMNITWRSNSSGSWATFNTNSSVNNGTYIQTNTNFSGYSTTYYWSVNATDSELWTNTTYHFRTLGSPVVTTNASTGVEETNATLHGYLSNNGSEDCTVWFQWGGTTDYGYTLATQTISLGEFNSSANETILMPNGEYAAPSPKYPDSGEDAYEDIDETTADGNTTYIYCNDNANWDINSFHFEDLNVSDVIYSVTISICANVNNSANNYSFVSPRIYNHSTGDALSTSPTSIQVDNDTSYHYYNFTWATTISDSIWSMEDINNSRVNVAIYNGNGSYETRVTQVRMIVNQEIAASPGTLYHYRAVASNTNGTSYGSDMTFLTKPLAPTGLTATVDNDTRIDLAWKSGTGANNTYIERNTIGDWARGDGTEVYNNTGTSYTNTGLSPTTNYTYQAWSYTSWSTSTQYSDANASDYAWTSPQSPQDVTYSLATASHQANLTINWTIGTGANYTLVRRSVTSMPATPDDGTLVYNGTSNGTVDANITEAYYYRLWSYNSTTGLYSDYVNLTWFAIWLNVYNESDGSNVTDWNIFITNELGDQTYSNTDCNNSLIINISSAPTGDRIAFIFSADGYEDRVYYRDIESDIVISIDAYLIPESDSELYLITVVGPQGEFTSSPIEGAYIFFKHYDDATETYVNVSSLYTDANGQVSLYLIPGDIYKVIISKTGYDTEISDYIPSDSIFTYTFRLTPETPTSVEYDDFWDTITFTGEMIDAGYDVPGNITITYADSNSSTTDTQIYLYEVYNGTLTLINTTSKVGNNSFSYTVSDINTTRMHSASLYFNNTANFVVTSPVTITILALHTLQHEKFDLEERMTSIFGSFDLGWANVIAVALALVVLVLLGPFNTGMGIIGCGLALGLTQIIFGMWVLNAFNPALILVTPVIIGLGMLYMFTVKPEEKL